VLNHENLCLHGIDWTACTARVLHVIQLSIADAQCTVVSYACSVTVGSVVSSVLLC